LKNHKILIVCAHIDDETFAMGGTIHKLSKHNEIKIITFCKGRILSKMKSRQNIIREYENLNIEISVLNNYDLDLEKYKLNENILQIEHIFKRFDPNIIFTHSKDNHPDHNIVSEVINVICRLKNNNIKKLYHFSVPGNAEWSRSDFKPNTFIEIDEEDSKFKKSLVKKYNELLNYEYPNPLSYKKIKSKEEYVGSIGGFPKAEAFQLISSREI